MKIKNEIEWYQIPFKAYLSYLASILCDDDIIFNSDASESTIFFNFLGNEKFSDFWVRKGGVLKYVREEEINIKYDEDN